MISVDIATIKLDDAIRLPYTSETIDFLGVMGLAFLGWVPLEQEHVPIGIGRLLY